VRVRSLAIVLLTALVWPPARADVVVSTLGGDEPLRGISLSADGDTISLHSADGPVIRVPTAEVIEIVALPPPQGLPPTARPFEVQLTDGSRLRGVLDEGPEDMLRLRSPILRESGARHIDIHLDHVRAVRRVDGRRIPGSSRLVRIPDSDAAYTLKGARLGGTVSRFTATGVVILRGSLAPRTIPYDTLAAIFVDSEEHAPLEGLHMVVRMADGSTAVLKKGFRVTGGVLSGTTPAGVSIRVAMARVAALGFMGGRFVHLSDLNWTSIKREPFFPLPDGPAAGAMLDFVCPVRLDRSPDGRPITLDNRRYFKGIGVRPRTELVYALQGNEREFQAVCGIDDEVLGPGYGRGAGTGSVVFSVYVDDRKVYESPRVVGGKPPQQVRVKLDGGKQLRLVVTRVPRDKTPNKQPDSPELDNAVWARPLLIR